MIRVKRMKILVTGANGYIGKHVVSRLLDWGHDVIALDFASNNIDTRASVKNLNIFDSSCDIYNECEQPDILVYLAWQHGFDHKSFAHIERLPDHYNFLTKMIDSGVKSVSVMGSMHEVGYWEGKVDENTPCNPLSLYGIAKNALRQAITLYAEDKNVSLKWLRAFYITGDDTRNQSVFSKILLAEKEGKSSFPFTDGLNKYDFTDINEVSEQIAAASVQFKHAGIINVCSGKPVALKDKVEDFIKKNNLKIKPEYGVFKTRKYDSPVIYGDNTRILEIMNEKEG